MPRNKSNKKPQRPRLKRVSVRAELRDEVDWDKFAYALLQHVRIKAKRSKSEDAS